jgi:hypothetical protein
VPVAVAVTITIVVVDAVTDCAISVVRYLALMMPLSCASSMVLLNCLPFLGFDKKKISIFYQGFFIVDFLVIRACSWLYWNILSKKSCLGFSLSLGFSQDKYLCLLVLVSLLLIYFSM